MPLRSRENKQKSTAFNMTASKRTTRKEKRIKEINKDKNRH